MIHLESGFCKEPEAAGRRLCGRGKTGLLFCDLLQLRMLQSGQGLMERVELFTEDVVVLGLSMKGEVARYV
jgi:hypothetical protein